MFITEKNTFIKKKKDNSVIYLKGEFEKPEDIPELLDSEFLKNKLLSNNGFQIVVETSERFYLISDIIRTFPLFYYVSNKTIIISDSTFSILSKLNNYTFSETAKKEFLLSGFVSESHTLVNEIRQLQAGEVVVISKKEAVVSKKFYHKLDYSVKNTENSNTLIAKLDKLHTHIFEHIQRQYKNRTLIVPLSGGYDSRLILALLLKSGLNNIICYTYGKTNNTESIISKKITQNYNLKWIFIEYNKYNLKHFSESKEYKDYLYKAGQMASLAHIQDLFAVKYLKENESIPNDSVFVPGHSYDFLAGSHISNIFLKQDKQFHKQEIIDYILNKHYSHWNNVNKTKISEKLNFAITDVKFPIPASKALEIVDNFNLKERQAKYIVNSIRAYEYYGYTSILPLWHPTLVDFWQKIPVESRYNRNLFKAYFKEKFKFETKTNHANEGLYKKMLKLVYTFKPIKILARKLKRIYEVKYDGIGLYYYFSYKEIIRNLLKATFLGPTSLLTKKFTDNIEAEKESI